MLDVKPTDTAQPDAAGAAGSPSSAPPVSLPVSPATPAAKAVAAADAVEGYLDGIQGRRVFGWAWCRSRPNDPVEVEVRLDDRSLVTVRADSLRADLAKAGFSDGRHGFDVQLDEPVAEEQKARLSVCARCGSEDGWTPLVNRTIKPAVPVKPAVKEAATAAPAVVDLQPVLGAVAAMRERVDERMVAWQGEVRNGLAKLAAMQSAAARQDSSGEVAAVREEIAKLVSAMEVLQMRIDACASAVQQASAKPAPGRNDRTLVGIVGGLGVVSGAALLLGLLAVFGS